MLVGRHTRSSPRLMLASRRFCGSGHIGSRIHEVLKPRCYDVIFMQIDL